MCVPHLGAGVVVEVPPRVVRDHLVVVVVEEGVPARGPRVAEQRRGHVVLAESVGSHDSDSFLATIKYFNQKATTLQTTVCVLSLFVLKSEVVSEELQGGGAVPGGVWVDLVAGADVGPSRVLGRV